MHKLVLLSGGTDFSSKDDILINHVISLCDKKDNFVFLPTACYDSRDDEEAVRNYCINHGFKNCTSLYLTDEALTDEYIKNTILSADAIYADGGNLKFLLDTWRKRKADVYLRQAYDSSTVMAGQSSGGMCWCKRGYDDCGLDGRFMFLDALNFVPYIMCPHFSGWQKHFKEDIKMQELDGIAIDDNLALSIVDGNYSIVNNFKDDEDSVYFLPADDEYRVHDLQKEEINIFIKNKEEIL